ncbi:MULTISPECIES: hypothetical protein [Thiomicrorhabdus]|uniref:Uncharacterized protein n=1 Tax=Thiomicrorhabdus heinhorstiae TaxID=2748010 RepID=A0ABS0C3U0_9GAMM|nr:MULTISPECIES: hypothetical protein [Thiomicrorhabdus]MBF6058801.1 hypothetical protein [Thiomicrorhabdus heinhorstiae]
MNPPQSMMDVQPGEHFVLKQAMTIPPDYSRQYIQYGQISGNSHNLYAPYCDLEVYQMSSQPQTINSERFKIIKVEIGESFTASKKPETLLAMNGPLSTNMLSFGGDYQRPESVDLVHLYLQSDKQPNVYRLTCGGSLSNGNLMDAPDSYRPERKQINQILGSVGKIEP